MLRIGFIGYRGMVGSVLLSRILCEEMLDDTVDLTFFSTSQAGNKTPSAKISKHRVADANDLAQLSGMDILISCQGADYTETIYPKLREYGWQGYWLDSASTLRMSEDSIIVLDPINNEQIDVALQQGIKNFIGGNCTVSLLLMALAGLFKEDLIEWVSTMTYQAASGAGAGAMRELLQQMQYLGFKLGETVNNENIIMLEKKVNDLLWQDAVPKKSLIMPLAGNLLAWIGHAVENGQTKEEQKAYYEVNKILQTTTAIPIDGICVRVAAMRCHSQALTIKLKKDLSLIEVERIISSAHQWIKVVPNTPQATLTQLNPIAISGSLDIAVGRIRPSLIGPKHFHMFTVGDQLLWGAAEPLYLMLKRLLKYCGNS